jgi:tripartite-type tricarboxylate transporter receptor subunit TctC
MVAYRLLLPAFVSIALAIAGIGRATAQAFPTHPITLGMPFAAGGPGDTLARILAERMRVSLGQPVIVENVTGASGSIGAGRARSARWLQPDRSIKLANAPRPILKYHDLGFNCHKLAQQQQFEAK